MIGRPSQPYPEGKIRIVSLLERYEEYNGGAQYALNAAKQKSMAIRKVAASARP